MIDPAELKTAGIHEILCLAGEYSFYVDGLPGTQVRFKIWLMDTELGGDRYTYTISHHVHTPTQMGPYHTSAPFARTEQACAERAIRDFLSFFQGAIKAGHQPSTKWLIPNSSF
jgi:hypothetical protein